MTKHPRSQITRLEDLPNIGKAMAMDLRRIGIQEPGELPGRDPYELYETLEKASGQRQDPCVLDVFISVVRFMEGGPPRPWWYFTSERKQTLLKASQVKSGGLRQELM